MTTPVRQQYLSIKSQYPDVIVFFRLGDFYETFDDDAMKASMSFSPDRRNSKKLTPLYSHV